MHINVKIVGLPCCDTKVEADHVFEESAGEIIPVDLPENARVDELVSRLRVCPDKILVNGKDASGETPLREGDAVALIGPSAGKE